MKQDLAQTTKRLTKCDIERASEILDKSTAALYQDVYRKRVPFRRMGRKIFFFEEELFEFLSKQPGVDVDEALAIRA